MAPVLFTIAGFPVRSYGLFVALSILAGIYIARCLARRQGYPWAEHLEDLAAWAVLGGIAGARIWEVVFSFDKYRADLLEVFKLWHGGLSIQGAIVGGLGAAIWFARRHRIAIWALLDTLAPAVVLAQGLGRLTACFLNGDAFGRPTGSAFGLVYPPSSAAYAVFGAQPLWPAEILEGLADLGIFLVLVRTLLARKRPGTVTLAYAALYSLARFLLEFLRGDSLMVGGLKAAQVTSLVVAAIAGLWLARRRLESH